MFHSAMYLVQVIFDFVLFELGIAFASRNTCSSDICLNGICEDSVTNLAASCFYILGLVVLMTAHIISWRVCYVLA
jgi:hypothetical protein